MELSNLSSSAATGEPASRSLVRRPWVIAVLLTFLTLIAFAPIWRAEFLTYDDPVYVTDNKNVQQGFTLSSLKWAFTSAHASNWHPVTWLSHMLDWQIFGNNPTGHHAVSLMLHVFNVILLFWLLHKMTGALWRSAFAAAIFAIHPTHVESVAWVAERKDVLSTCFGLLSMLAYYNYVKSGSGTRNRVVFYGLALLLFTLGLMSKPMLVTLPFVFMLLDYWPLGRLAGTGTNDSATSSKPSGKVLVLEKVPFLVLVAVAVLLTLWAQAKEAIISTDELSFYNRITTAVVSYVRYIGKFVWPTDLAPHYPHPGAWPWWNVVGSALILAPLSWLFIHLRKQRPYLFVGWLLFLGTLVPVIGVVQAGTQSIADRYLYIPSIGLAVMIVWYGAEVIGRLKTQRSFVLLCLTSGILFLGTLLTFRQTLYWTNSIKLFRHALKVTSNNVVAHNQLGSALILRGELEEADFHFKRAIELDKTDFYGHANLGNVLMQKGRTAEAVPHYEAAVAANADDPEARSSLGEALLHQAKFEEAAEQFSAAMTLAPSNVRAKVGYAHSLLARGRHNEAELAYRDVLEHAPDHRGASYGLATVMVYLGRDDEALQRLRAARKEASDAQLRAEFALLLSQAGHFASAAQEYREALRLQPDSVNVLNNLAWLLATCPDPDVRNGKEAVRYAKEACALTGFEIPVFIGTLAAAYAEAGDFTKAAETAERAQSLAASKGQPEIASRNADLLKLYRDNRPYHEAPPNAGNAAVLKP